MNNRWQRVEWRDVLEGAQAGRWGSQPSGVGCLASVLEQTTRNVYLELAHVERFVVRNRT